MARSAGPVRGASRRWLRLRWGTASVAVLAVLAALLPVTAAAASTPSDPPAGMSAVDYVATSSVVPPTRPPVPPGPTVVAATTLTQDTVWGPEGSPYVLHHSLDLRNGATLTMLPGTVVKMGPEESHHIEIGEHTGRILALGTVANPVTITSLADDSVGGDTNGDGAATLPAPGDWGRLYVGSNAIDVFDHVDVRYGGGLNSQGFVCGGNAELEDIEYGSPTSGAYVTNSMIQKSLDSGFHSSVSPQKFLGLYNNTFANNSLCGADLANHDELIGNQFSGNAKEDLLAQYAGHFLALYNTFRKHILVLSSNDRADVHYNSLLDGVDPTYPGDSITDWSDNYWAAGLPQTLSGCAPAQSTFTAPAETRHDNSCPSGNAYTGNYYLGSFGGAYLTVKPALSAAAGFALPFAKDLGPMSQVVNAASGALHLTATDLQVADAGSSLASARGYDSDASGASDLGTGWSRSFSSSRTTSTDGSSTFTADNGQSSATGTDDGGNALRNPTDLTSHVTNADGSVTQTSQDQSSQTFDANGHELSRSEDDPARKITFSRDGAGQLSRATGVSGRYLDYTRDGQNRVQAITDSSGRGVTFGRTGGLLTGVTGVDGRTTGYGYDGSNRLTSITSPAGVATLAVSYDSQGRVATYQPAGGPLVTMQYHPDQYYTIAIRGTGAGQITTRYDYDTLGRATLTRNNNGPGTGYIYDGASRVVMTLTGIPATAGGTERPQASAVHYDPYTGDPTITVNDTNQLLRTTFDTSHHPLVTTWPDGTTLTRTYDSNHRLLSSKDRANRTTTFTYNTLGEVTSITGLGLLGTSRCSYAGNGDLTGVTDRAGATTAVSTDSLGRITTSTDPTGRITQHTYTSFDAPDTTTTPNGAITRWTYNTDRQLATRTTPASASDGSASTTSYGYDSSGRLTTVTDPLGRTTTRGYDIQGRLANLTDPAGGVTSYGYDADGNRTQVTDPLGSTSRATFDLFGRQTSQTNNRGFTTLTPYDHYGHSLGSTLPDGASTAIAYNGVCLDRYCGDPVPATVTDPANVTTALTFNSLDQLTLATDPQQHKVSYSYDTSGLKTAVTDPLNRTTYYGYDPAGRLLSTTDPLGTLDSRSYDTAGRIVTRTDGNNHTTTTHYDLDGNIDRVTDPTGAITSYTRNPAGLVTAITDPLGRITTRSYDAAGQLLTQTTPGHHTTSYSYDNAGNTTRITDPRGGITSQAYDLNHQLTRRTDPLNNTTRYSYDTDGNLTGTTDADGHTTSTAYDANDRPVIITNPAGASASTSYTPTGQVAASTDRYGITTTNSYDTLDRLATSTRSGGDPAHPNTTSYSYDAASQLLQAANPLLTVTRSYDTRGQLTHDCAATCHTLGYDNAGNLTTDTDALQHTTSYGYDADNRPTTTTDALNHTVTTGYDLAGQRTSVALPRGGTWTYSYDDDGNLSTLSDPLHRNETRHYDPAGALTRRDLASGRAQTLTVDLLGRVTATHATSPTDATLDTSYSYDPVGNLLTAANSTAGTGIDNETFTYTALDQLATGSSHLTTPTATGSPRATIASSYSYDTAGRLTRAAVDNTNPITYSYLAGGDITAITGLPDGNGYYFHDATGRPTGYNATSSTAPDPGDTTTWTPTGPTTITRNGGTQYLHFTYDAAGRPTQQDRRLPADSATLGANTQPVTLKTTYSYDNANRLTSEGDTTSTGYTYDADGNRTQLTTPAGTTTYNYNLADQLTTDSSNATYTYDPDGNLTRISYPTSTVNTIANSPQTATSLHQPRSYTYDSAGQLSGAQLPNTDASPAPGQPTLTTLAYTRDALGRLSTRTALSTLAQTTGTLGQLSPATSTLITTLDYDGTTNTPAVIDDPNNLNALYHDPNGSLLADHNVSKATSDTLDTRATTNAHGDLTSTAHWYGAYDSFGNLTAQAALNSNGSITGTLATATGNIKPPVPLGFQSAYTDPLLGTTELPARSYTAAYGRFNQADSTIGSPDNTSSYNRYDYGNLNPVLLTDPTGHNAVGDALNYIGRQISSGYNYFSSNLSAGFSSFTSDAGAGSSLWQGLQSLKQTLSSTAALAPFTNRIQTSLNQLAQFADSHQALVAGAAGLLVGGACEVASEGTLTPICLGLANGISDLGNCHDTLRCAQDGVTGLVAGAAGGAVLSGITRLAPAADSLLGSAATNGVSNGIANGTLTTINDLGHGQLDWRHTLTSTTEGAILGAALGGFGHLRTGSRSTLRAGSDAEVAADTIPAEAGPQAAEAEVPAGYSSFKAAKTAMGSPGQGNVFDHVVEQSQIGRSSFAPEEIHNAFNMNPVSAGTNQLKANYYSTKQFFTGGGTVRDWLTGQSFADQYEFGMDVLHRIENGVPLP